MFNSYSKEKLLYNWNYIYASENAALSQKSAKYHSIFITT